MGLSMHAAARRPDGQTEIVNSDGRLGGAAP
jgi:hypothetical protein